MQIGIERFTLVINKFALLLMPNDVFDPVIVFFALKKKKIFKCKQTFFQRNGGLWDNYTFIK